MAEESTSPSFTTNSFGMSQIHISRLICLYQIPSYLSALAGYPAGGSLAVLGDLDGTFLELLAVRIDRHLEPGKLHGTEDVDSCDKGRSLVG